MRYRKAQLEALAYTLPEQVVTSVELEARLAPTYERLRLPEGRLQLQSGIRERRFWEPGVLPSDKSIESGRRALEAADFDPRNVGALVHASVCRDHLEPATACRVHHALGLPPNCLLFDLSNACLGILNGIVHVANMIELGQIRAGLVVGTESSRQLVETTIDRLNNDASLTRSTIKLAAASLTIGSGSAAVLVCDRSIAKTNNRLAAATWSANTTKHRLCHSGEDEAVASGMKPLMLTESEELMHAGIATGVETFARFLDEAGWRREEVDKTFCHQVGLTHRRLMLESLELDGARDFTTVEMLGNTGSVALPITMARGIEQGFLSPGDRVAMLGIGSGINCLMLAVEWGGES